MRFIRLTVALTKRHVFMNADHIVTVYRAEAADTETQVLCVNDRQGSEEWFVLEKPDQVMRKIMMLDP